MTDPVPSAREIRVHGVSGTAPHSMLGVHDYQVTQVSGDHITGLYRCRPGTSPRNVAYPADVEVVAYSWGSLTSGASGFMGGARRALWLTLLPFALANLSYWARPDLDTARRPRIATAVAVREACLMMTWLLTAAMCFIGIDMIAWQCFRGGAPVCPALPSQLSFMSRPPWDAAGMRLLIGSSLPLACLALLWWLSKNSLARYEGRQSRHDTPGGGEGVLRRQRMWVGTDRTALLQRLHIGSGLLLVVVFGLAPLLRYAERDRLWWAGAALAAVTVAMLVGTAVSVGVSYRDGIDFPGTHETLATRVAAALPWGAVLALACYGLLMAFADIPERFDDPGLTRGRNLLVGALALVLVGIVSWLIFAADRPGWALVVPLALAATAWVGVFSRPAAVALGAGLLVVCMVFQNIRSSAPDVPRAWHGAGAALILGAAVWVALLFTTSLVVFLGNWLNGGQPVTALRSEFTLASSPGAFAAQVQQGAPVLLATGQVVVRGAILERSGPDFFVLRAGTVSASSVTTPDGETVRTTPDLDVSAGLLLIDDPPLQLVQGCVTDPGVPCEVGDIRDTWINQLSGPMVIDGPVRLVVANTPQEPVVVPQVLIWFSGLTVVWAGASLLAIALGFFVFALRARSTIAGQLGADGIPEQERRRSGRARLLAGFTHRAERLLAVTAVITSACGVLLVVGVVADWQPWRDSAVAAALVNGGLWLAMLMSAVLIVLVGKLMNATGFWRVVGVLWDLTTFWPRVAHPLGPPCYAERVVPEIVDEVVHSQRQGSRLILSGHSQGSLIGVAVLSQVAAITGNLNSVRFLTYGSQLRTLYGRVFPAVLGPHVLGCTPTAGAPPLSRAWPDAPDAGTAGSRGPPAAGANTLAQQLQVPGPLPNWVNLFRRTDPIGFRVFADQSSRVDRYVSEQDPPARKVRGHSDMQFSAVYGQVVLPWASAQNIVDGQGPHLVDGDV